MFQAFGEQGQNTSIVCKRSSQPDSFAIKFCTYLLLFAELLYACWLWDWSSLVHHRHIHCQAFLLQSRNVTMAKWHDANLLHTIDGRTPISCWEELCQCWSNAIHLCTAYSIRRAMMKERCEQLTMLRALGGQCKVRSAYVVTMKVPSTNF